MSEVVDFKALFDELDKIIKLEAEISRHYAPDEPMTYAERYRGVEHAYSEGDEPELDAPDVRIPKDLDFDTEDDIGGPIESTDSFVPDYVSPPIKVTSDDDEDGDIDIRNRMGITPEGAGVETQSKKEIAYSLAKVVVNALNRRKFTKPYSFQNASPEDFETYVRDTIIDTLYTLPADVQTPHISNYIIEYSHDRTMLGFEFDTDIGEVTVVLKAPSQGDTWQVIDFSFGETKSKPKITPEPELEPEIN